MGVGAPDDLVENVIRGIDMFDCVLPTRIARHGTALTSFGKIVIKNAIYEKDYQPLDANINSLASPYTRSYIRHLFKAEELLAMRLVTHQNLCYLKKLMADIRQAIKADRLLDFKAELMAQTNYFKSK